MEEGYQKKFQGRHGKTVTRDLEYNRGKSERVNMCEIKESLTSEDKTNKAKRVVSFR